MAGPTHAPVIGTKHTSWIELAPLITSVVSGGLDSDPDSIEGSLTVTTSTGSFGGITVPCNQFGWTTHASINDGFDEAAYVEIDTFVGLFPSYDPTAHGYQLAADLVSLGSFSASQPQLAIFASQDGTPSGSEWSAGWTLQTSSSILPSRFISATNNNDGPAFDPTGLDPRMHSRRFGLHGVGANALHVTTCVTDSNTYASIIGGEYTANDSVRLFIGNSAATSEAVSGIKIRFRIRFFELLNINLSDFDLGVAI